MAMARLGNVVQSELFLNKKYGDMGQMGEFALKYKKKKKFMKWHFWFVVVRCSVAPL